MVTSSSKNTSSSSSSSSTSDSIIHRKDSAAWQGLAAIMSGSAAGLTADACTHPIDTLRTRLQVQNRQSAGAYRGTWDAFVRTRLEGIRGFYRGFSVVATFTIPAHALYFFGYETGKRYIMPNTPVEEKGPVVHFFSGVVAEIFGATIWTPQDVIKQRLQVHTAERKSPWKTVRSIVKADGVLGLWRGLGPGLATYCPFVGIYFMTYEHLKSTALRHYGLTTEEQLPFVVSLLSGASAGGLAAAITCPLDVIKTRVQVGRTVYRSGWHAFTELLRNEGPRALLSGLLPRVMWIAPGCAIAIASYERFKSWFWVTASGV